jgi:hypothetical protein
MRRLNRLPHREIGSLDGGPYGLIYDPVLGYLGALAECGRWHLDWQRIYARPTSGGLAITLLRQDSPRLVDVLLSGVGCADPGKQVGGGVRAELARCPRHGTPVVLP